MILSTSTVTRNRKCQIFTLKFQQISKQHAMKTYGGSEGATLHIGELSLHTNILSLLPLAFTIRFLTTDLQYRNYKSLTKLHTPNITLFIFCPVEKNTEGIIVPVSDFTPSNTGYNNIMIIIILLLFL
jgi:hypothetical protein